MRTIPLPRDVDALVLGLWEEHYVQYAWLGCLAYTTDRTKVAEMLTYVLVISYLMAEMLKIPKASPESHDSVIEVIDVMLEVVGPDYRSDLLRQNNSEA